MQPGILYFLIVWEYCGTGDRHNMLLCTSWRVFRLYYLRQCDDGDTETSVCSGNVKGSALQRARRGAEALQGELAFLLYARALPMTASKPLVVTNNVQSLFSTCVPACLPACLPVCLSVCLSAFPLSVCLSCSLISAADTSWGSSVACPSHLVADSIMPQVKSIER